MKRKNLISIVIIAILVIIAGILIGNNRYLSSLRSEASDFSVYDTASITKLFFADKSGNTVVLSRNDNGWMVNNEYPANQNPVNDIGVSRETGSCAIRIISRTFSGLMFISLAISSAVTSLPTFWSRSREVFVTLWIVSTICTGILIVLA